MLSCPSCRSSGSLLRLVLISRGVIVGSSTNVEPTFEPLGDALELVGEMMELVGETVETARSDNRSISSTPPRTCCPKLPALAWLSRDAEDELRLMLENEPKLGYCDNDSCCGGNASTETFDSARGEVSADSPFTCCGCCLYHC